MRYKVTKTSMMFKAPDEHDLIEANNLESALETLKKETDCHQFVVSLREDGIWIEVYDDYRE